MSVDYIVVLLFFFFFYFSSLLFFCLFFFNDTATTEIYTLSLHDALPIFTSVSWFDAVGFCKRLSERWSMPVRLRSKSTRLNSSHRTISYAVFCLKKKKKKKTTNLAET